MTRRYWVATLGNWLGLPLMLLATSLAVTDRTPIGIRIFCCLGLYIVGWGTYRFQSVMQEERKGAAARSQSTPDILRSEK